MIRFNFIEQFNSSDLLHWALVDLLFLLPVLQIVLLLRHTAISGGRKWVRLALNILLWLVLVGYVLQPSWRIPAESGQVLLVGEEVPAAFVQHLKDSLQVAESRTSAEFLDEEDHNSGYRADSVTLVGQGFSTEILGQLSDRSLLWIPYIAPDQLHDLRWKGVVRKGERQRVRGNIHSSKEQYLKLRYADHILDSVQVREGNNSFQLEYPAFSEGRTETLLTLGSQVLDTLRYYTRPAKYNTIHFILDSPDFESKTLANWLGKQGHKVQVSASLSKDINSSLSINTPGKEEADMIITDAAHATHSQVKKAVADGKSVLFLNLTDPIIELKGINRAVGSSWKVKKTSNELTVNIGNELTALSYSFTDALNQNEVTQVPVAVQRTSGKVGVSLLTETYPLQLSGDSLTYSKVWKAILAELQPATKENIQVDAPLFRGIRGRLQFNDFASKPASVLVGNDTIHLHYSAINPLTAEARYLPDQSGWVSSQDSTEVYVEDGESFGSLYQIKLISSYLRTHSRYSKPALTRTPQRQKVVRLPDWLWLLLFIVCFTALWVEPRLQPKRA
ncbi:hypothetical protein [Telluribacter humicola]|uniref:hypothetical protein n=1 Tax=Telluribacter humicola TaxID=1720261 RepID=UPI001A95EB3E|nr:hypothetical protein [Telluribacter humicola]